MVRKRSYRGKGRRNRKRKTFTLLLSNLRGFKSKQVSLDKVIQNLSPTVLMYNETLMYGNNKVETDGYLSFSKNRTTKSGGGISTSVKEELKEFTVGAGEGQGEDKYLVTRLECYSPPLTLVNCYGEQKSVGPVE